MGKTKESDIDYIIFTDASLRSSKITKRDYCGYGIVILNLRDKTYTSLKGYLGGKSCVYGEGYAVYRGITTLGEIVGNDKGNDKQIQALMVTDSKLTVQAVSLYIPYIWDLSDPNDWKKVTGESVKNQSLYKKIVKAVDEYDNIHFRITHINSHKDKMKQWTKVRDTLAEYNIWVNKKSIKIVW